MVCLLWGHNWNRKRVLFHDLYFIFYITEVNISSVSPSTHQRHQEPSSKNNISIDCKRTIIRNIFFLSFLNTPVTHNTQQGIFFIHLQHFEIVKCINRQELHKHNATKMDSKIKDPSKHVPYHYQILNERRWRYNNPIILYLKYTALFLYPCIVFLHHICKKNYSLLY